MDDVTALIVFPAIKAEGTGSGVHKPRRLKQIGEFCAYAASQLRLTIYSMRLRQPLIGRSLYANGRMTEVASKAPTCSQARASFVDKVWNRFDLVRVIETLLAPEEAFFAEKQISFGSLAAWIIDPANDELRKLAVARQIALQSICLEGERLLRCPSSLGNMVRHIQQFAEPEVARFYEEAYFPIGGMKTIVSTNPSSRFLEEIDRVSGGVNTAIGILSIYHFCVTELADRELFYPPSLNKAATLLSKSFDQKPKRGEGGANPDNIRKQWQRCRVAVPFAYAASEISVKDHKYSDLLDVMQRGHISWDKHGCFLPKLLGRAYFVEEHILTKCYKNEGVPVLLGALDNIRSLNFQPRKLSPNEMQNTRKEFARQPGVNKSS